ncbi:hypothetical protein RE428_32260 [Marinobacter nanhaiticus D15-8W]|uniref:Uncharacterized protein n=1 Tax=Marinobacter nanhaiticus D15-8W TaxID=626887 RepID=N6X0E5_9GAMM|nr:hypothetical protein [Marinobacter nanhaiticus]ENO16917.1 hypothetical protein J057_01895 [Marinobacter nanhaiticus D15-8W]BES72208.1 hypothetical protein RE428_32260 [Marinobacter nanhaiticus D15-8W]
MVDPVDKELREHLAQVDAEDREEAAMELWWSVQYHHLFHRLLNGDTITLNGKPLVGPDEVEQQMYDSEIELVKDAYKSCHINYEQAGEILDMAKRNSIKALLEQYKQNLWDAEKAEPDDVDFFEYREAI